MRGGSVGQRRRQQDVEVLQLPQHSPAYASPSRAIAAGKPVQVAPCVPLEAQRQVVQPGAVERRAEPLLAAAHQGEREQRPVQQEVVDEGLRHRWRSEVLDAMTHPVEQRSGGQRRVFDFRAAFALDGLGEHADAQPFAARSGDVADRREFGVAPDLLDLAVERGRIADRPGDHAVGDDADRHLAHGRRPGAVVPGMA